MPRPDFAQVLEAMPAISRALARGDLREAFELLVELESGDEEVALALLVALVPTCPRLDWLLG